MAWAPVCTRRLPALGRTQVGHGGGAAPAVARGELVIARAFLFAGVEVAHARHAQAGGGLDHGLDQRMRRLDRGGAQRAAHAARRALAQVVVLQPAEVGQAVFPAPAGIAGGGPGIVVGALAPDIDQAIDGAGAAQRGRAASRCGGPACWDRDRCSSPSSLPCGTWSCRSRWGCVSTDSGRADRPPAGRRHARRPRSAGWPARIRPNRRPPRCSPLCPTCRLSPGARARAATAAPRGLAGGHGPRGLRRF